MSVINERADASQSHVDTVIHPSSVWILLRGEADIATAAELDTALKAVPLARQQSVRFHLGELGYADVRTLCQLAMFAHQARGAGHTVMTCRASPTLRRIAEHLGIHDELGVLPESPSFAGGALDPRRHRPPT